MSSELLRERIRSLLEQTPILLLYRAILVEQARILLLETLRCRFELLQARLQLVHIGLLLIASLLCRNAILDFPSECAILFGEADDACSLLSNRAAAAAIVVVELSIFVAAIVDWWETK